MVGVSLICIMRLAERMTRIRAHPRTLSRVSFRISGGRDDSLSAVDPKGD